MKQDYEEECLVMINLDQAMERHEFQVYYQPIYEAKTGKIVAAEALVRWIPEPGRMVSPGRFIPILEKSGHITRLDFFVAEQVLTFQRERYHAGKAVYPVSVNLSRMDLMDEHIIQMIRKNILQTDLPADMVRYEVTESAYTDITKMEAISWRKCGSRVPRFSSMILEAEPPPSAPCAIIPLMW